MTAFRYVAVRPDDGVKVRGRLDVTSSREAADLLARRGLVPVSVELIPADVPGGSVPVRLQATTFRSLATLVDAAIPLASALRLAGQTADARVRDALARVEARVREGLGLAAALDAEGGFSQLAVGLVRAAEGGGGLAAGLAQCADELERQVALAARLRSALAYPTILAVVGAASVLMIVTLVVPRFAALLADVDVTLPLSTRALLSASVLLREHAALALLVPAGATAIAWNLVAVNRSRWHAWLIAAPVLGGVRHRLATARAARTLAALLDAGAPALTALRLAMSAAGDVVVGSRLEAASTRVAEGAAFSSALEAEHAFTPLATQLTRIGEDAGRLPELLRRAATMEQQAAEQRIQTLVTLTEPALIVVFALIVAFVAGALLRAVYSVTAGSL